MVGELDGHRLVFAVHFSRRCLFHIVVIGRGLRRSGDNLIQLDLGLRRSSRPGMERKALGESSAVVDRKQTAWAGRRTVSEIGNHRATSTAGAGLICQIY